MKSQVYVIGIIAAGATFFAACANEHDSSKRKKFFGPSSGDEFTTVDVEAASTEEDALFALAGESVQTTKLKVSCDGIAEEIVEDSQFDLPVGSTNCIAKLMSITIGDKTYVEPASGSGFTHYLKNDVGKMVNQNNSNEIIYMKVKEQLPSPLTADPSVIYVYSAVTKFDTIEAENTAIDALPKTFGTAAPQIKVSKAIIGPGGRLAVHVECTATGGFTGSLLSDLKCGDAHVKDLKVALDMRDEETELKDSDLKEIIAKGDSVDNFAKNEKRAVYSISSKTLNLIFPEPKERKTHVLVAGLSKDSHSSYAYGFIRLGGSKAQAKIACDPQGTQANFIHAGVVLNASNRGIWRDTSNCYRWQRVITNKVLAKDRFKHCPAIKSDSQIQHRTLPYYRDLKAARDRNIHTLAKGAAPALGANLDQETFWLAGGRVFNMKDGSVRQGKSIRLNEKHSVLCVTRKTK